MKTSATPGAPCLLGYCEYRGSNLICSYRTYYVPTDADLAIVRAWNPGVNPSDPPWETIRTELRAAGREDQELVSETAPVLLRWLQLAKSPKLPSSPRVSASCDQLVWQYLAKEKYRTDITRAELIKATGFQKSAVDQCETYGAYKQFKAMSGLERKRLLESPHRLNALFHSRDSTE